MSRFGLCVVLVSCVPAPIDYTGKMCMSDRPCPDGWDCVEMKCAGHNLLTNGDFDGGTAGWEASPGLLSSTDAGHVGGGAVLSGTGDVTLQPTDKFPSGNDGATYCLKAWLAGRDTISAGLVMQTTDENVGTFASATVSMSGSETRMSRQVDPQKVLTVQITGTLSASDTLTVDDVVLWRSQLGSCSER